MCWVLQGKLFQTPRVLSPRPSEAPAEPASVAEHWQRLRGPGLDGVGCQEPGSGGLHGEPHDRHRRVPVVEDQLGEMKVIGTLYTSRCISEGLTGPSWLPTPNTEPRKVYLERLSILGPDLEIGRGPDPPTPADAWTSDPRPKPFGPIEKGSRVFSLS